MRHYREGSAFTPFPALYVGPFGVAGGDADEPTELLEFAPTADAAGDAKYADSEAAVQEGNVLSRRDFGDPVDSVLGAVEG